MNKPIPHHVQQFGTQRRNVQQRIGAILRSNRFTFGGVLLLAIIIPELFHPFIRHQYRWAQAVGGSDAGLYVSALALMWTHVLLRKVGTLPLVSDKLLILPTFLINFGLAFVFLVAAYGGSSYYHLTTSFVAGLAWYFFIALMRARMSSPRLAFVGNLSPDEELRTTRVEWVPLLTTRLPNNVHAIVYDMDLYQTPAWERLFCRAVLRNIPVYDLAHFREMVTGRVRLTLRPEKVFGDLLPSQPYLRAKRMLDTLVVIPALVLALPLIAILCLLIRLGSPGDGIFRQTRVGYQGRKFTCYKLRTMRADHNGLAYTAEADPRITPLGRTLGKWRLDELPQLINILKGDMSWIGPRPEADSLARDYAAAIPYYAYRHAVRPGISGWAAVHQGNVALADAITVKLEYDFYYLKNFSIWLDFLIALMTIRTIVSGFGHR